MRPIDIESFIIKQLPKREFFTVKEIVKSGLYGSKSSVRRDILQKKLDIIWVSDRRLLVTRKSLIDLLVERNKVSHLFKNFLVE